MSSLKIGFMCGSLRKGSINQKLTRALQAIAKDKGATPIYVDLGSYELPIYHGDLETPKGVQALIDDMSACHGIVIVSPEYNGGLPALLKNALDWTSKVTTDHIKGPVFGIGSCTPGPMSGIMVMRELQFLLMRLGADLVPMQVGCGSAASAFDDEGNLIAERPASFANMMFDQMLSRIASKR